MSLSCECGYGEYDWYYDAPVKFEPFDRKRRKRCASCKELVEIGADCLIFTCYREPWSEVDERIYGDQVPLANKYMCGQCGEIFLNLTDAGYCLSLGHNIKEDLEEYWDITGFKPKK